MLLLVSASQAMYHATLTHVFHLLRSNITTDDVTTTQALMWLCAVGFSPRDHRLLLDLGLVSCVAELYALSGSAGSTGTGTAGAGYVFAHQSAHTWHGHGGVGWGGWEAGLPRAPL